MNQSNEKKKRENKPGTKQSMAPFAWIDEIGEGKTKLSKNPSLIARTLPVVSDQQSLPKSASSPKNDLTTDGKK